MSGIEGLSERNTPLQSVVWHRYGIHSRPGNANRGIRHAARAKALCMFGRRPGDVILRSDISPARDTEYQDRFIEVNALCGGFVADWMRH